MPILKHIKIKRNSLKQNIKRASSRLKHSYLEPHTTVSGTAV